MTEIIGLKENAAKILPPNLKYCYSMKNRQSQRTVLELHLETSPKVSKYSNKLLELMQREEALMSENSSDSSATISQLATSIEQGLSTETTDVFERICRQNIKKWNALDQKLVREFAKLLRNNAVASQNSGMNADFYEANNELFLETKRLEEYYNKNWFDIENFHLQEAFKSQSSRIDAEWAAREASELHEYIKLRSKVTGVLTPIQASSVDFSQAGDSRWQSPEKQKTLVQTVPIMSPHVSPHAASKHAHNASINEIEKDHIDAIFELNKQKIVAKKWMSRQQLRFRCQSLAVHKERKIIGNLISSELKDCILIKQHI